VAHSRGGTTRGVARRNAKLTQLRGQVRKDLAIVAVDLAAGEQAAVVADHDSRVLGRRKFRGPAQRIEAILGWAAPIAASAGFAGVMVACEPTGHRWKVVLQAARGRGLAMVCVQPMLVARAREAEDYTGNKSDYGDAVIIARLVAELRCYIPTCRRDHGRGCGTWECAGRSCWTGSPRPASACWTCSNVAGRRSWVRRRSQPNR
jgi:transposase